MRVTRQNHQELSPAKRLKMRRRAAILAFVSALGLTIIKFTAALLSHSVSMLSEAMHSLLDLISATVAFFAVQEAAKPADAGHPFGHGKIETLSSLFESLFLMGAAVFIFSESIGHLRNPKAIENENLALVVMLISIVVSYLVYLHNRYAGKVTESAAIAVNATHFLSDMLTSVTVVIALVLIRFTEWMYWDGIFGIGIGCYLFYAVYQQTRDAILELVDVQLPRHEIERVRKAILPFQPRFVEVHDLRTRKGGTVRYIDFHLLVCAWMSVNESHELCDEMEAAIEREFPSAMVSIHVEPCHHRTQNCHLTCPIVKELKSKGVNPA